MPANNVPAVARQIARECIAVRVRLLNRLVTGVCDDALRPHGVRVAQVNVLCAIGHSGPVTPTDLARALVLDKSTLSRDVDKLRASGWVEATPTADGRSHTLAITAQGVAFLEQIHPLWQKAQQELTEQLGPDLLGAVRQAVDQIWARNR